MRQRIEALARSLVARVSEGRIPTWVLGGLLALLTWRVSMDPPSPGIDLSWNAGLAMAAHRGLHFGTEVIFTFGPLGFLRGQWVWYDDLAVIAFCYGSAVYLALCTSLIWALRRAVPVAVAFATGYFVLTLLAGLELSIILPALVCLGMLARQNSARAVDALVVGGASYAAVELLVKLSTGPVILAMLLITLVGLRARWWQLAGFFGLLAVELILLWWISGQALANVPDFIGNAWEISSGYSAAMAIVAEIASVSSTVAVMVAFAVLVGLVAATYMARYRDRRARWSAVLLMAIAGFLMFKEGVVRGDESHFIQFVSTACVLWLAIPWLPTQRLAMLGGAVVIAAMALHARPANVPAPELDAIGSISKAGTQVRNLLSRSRRDHLAELGRGWMQGTYALEPETLAALQGHTVAVDPYEIGVAWAYGLDWQPLPVFQNYSAYTERLDRLNSDAVASDSGPERILRENPPLVFPEFVGPALDERFPGWDPPEQAREVLCHFAPLHTSDRWQVLGRVRDRCGAPHLVRTVEAAYGTPVQVPSPGPDEAVFARIHGVEVNGLERIRTLLVRAQLRFAVLNGGAQRYRVVPDTAADGLMLRASDGVAGQAPFEQVPQARTIELTGASGDLRYEFFRIRVRPTGGAAERQPAG